MAFNTSRHIQGKRALSLFLCQTPSTHKSPSLITTSHHKLKKKKIHSPFCFNNKTFLVITYQSTTSLTTYSGHRTTTKRSTLNPKIPNSLTRTHLNRGDKTEKVRHKHPRSSTPPTPYYPRNPEDIFYQNKF